MALLTARVAAERLGVGYPTLKRWVRSGTVRTTRTADAVRALKLRRGDDAIASIKSTEVMVARPVKSSRHSEHAAQYERRDSMRGGM